MSITPDWTIIPMWFIFMTALFILHHYVFKPTLAILTERVNRTAGCEKEAGGFNEESESKFKEYEVLMAKAREKARVARDEILSSASKQQKEIIGEARQVAEEELKRVKKQIAQESELARQKLKDDAKTLAKEMVNQLIERKVA